MPPPVLHSILLGTLFLLFTPLSSISTAAAAPAAPTPQCKTVPGSPDWPTPETWQRLNESTGGQLLRPNPPGAVCHPGQPSYDAAECRRVQVGWSTYEFHGEDPVSADWNQWNNDSCLPIPGFPCSARGYPAFVLNATTPEHVKLGVDFGTATTYLILLSIFLFITIPAYLENKKLISTANRFT